MEDIIITREQAKTIAHFIYSNLNDYIKELEEQFLSFLSNEVERRKEENEKN